MIDLETQQWMSSNNLRLMDMKVQVKIKVPYVVEHKTIKR